MRFANTCSINYCFKGNNPNNKQMNMIGYHTINEIIQKTTENNSILSYYALKKEQKKKSKEKKSRYHHFKGFIYVIVN